MVPCCLFQDLSPKHLHSGKGILRTLGHSTVGPLGNWLRLGHWWSFYYKYDIEFGATSSNGRSSLWGQAFQRCTWWDPCIKSTVWRSRAYTAITCVRPMLRHNTSSQCRCTWFPNWWTSYSSSKSPSLFYRVHLASLTCNPWILLALLDKESTAIPMSREPE